MKIFAIGDLHLPGLQDKPMNIFDPAWENHARRMEDAWREIVSAKDVVLLPGDFSWAMRLSEARDDMRFLAALPGTKVMVRGNHDYWWNSLSKVRAALPPSIRVVQNDHIAMENIAIGGTRGWVCPQSAAFTQEDEKIYLREVNRLSLSLSCMPETKVKLIMLHYPPFNERRAPSGFTELLEAHGVRILLYGHLHGKSCKNGFEGLRNGVEYHLVSADHIGFKPKFVLEV
ncbi:MAG: metallophosphoesterase [Clostridiales bacterium]|jgi:predicted phosphohydrolase|nr:metallophosphoesterase [Clostridiales bacterium]